MNTINDIKFNTIEFAVLRAVYGSITTEQTVELIKKRIKMEDDFLGSQETIDKLKQALELHNEDEEFFYNIYERINIEG